MVLKRKSQYLYIYKYNIIKYNLYIYINIEVNHSFLQNTFFYFCNSCILCMSKVTIYFSRRKGTEKKFFLNIYIQKTTYVIL